MEKKKTKVAGGGQEAKGDGTVMLGCLRAGSAATASPVRSGCGRPSLVKLQPTVGLFQQCRRVSAPRGPS